MENPNCRCEIRHVIKPVTIWGYFRWQMRMAIAEKGLRFWFWLAGDHVPWWTLKAYLKLLASLPGEPISWTRHPGEVPARRPLWKDGA